MRNALLALCLAAAGLALVAAPRPAAAQGSDGTGLGIGVESMLTEFGFATAGTFLTGPAVVYQTPLFHAEAITHYEGNGITTFGVAGRFFYEIHSTQASDVSLGGGVGFVNIELEGVDESQTDVHLEVGGKVRAFVTPRVAINASFGLGVVLVDSDSDIFAITGQAVGGAGITYFFF
jgi:hypothetical protein